MRQKEDTFKRRKEGSCGGKEETNDLFLKSFQGHVQAQQFRFFLDTQDIRGKTGGWSIGTQVMGLLENLFFFRVLRFSPSEKRNSFHSFFLFGRGDFRSGFYCCLLRANTGWAKQKNPTLLRILSMQRSFAKKLFESPDVPTKTFHVEGQRLPLTKSQIFNSTLHPSKGGKKKKNL